MEEKKNSNSPLRREKSDLTGASVKWVGDKPSASKNPFRYSYLVLGPIYSFVFTFFKLFAHNEAIFIEDRNFRYDSHTS